jgi:hypothetical protein
VSHVQHLRWYPHVRDWHRRVERVIKHMVYAEYVGEDLAALPRHQWNRGRRRVAHRRRERKEVYDDEASVMEVVAADWQQLASGSNGGRRRGGGGGPRRLGFGRGGLGHGVPLASPRHPYKGDLDP